MKKNIKEINVESTLEIISVKQKRKADLIARRLRMVGGLGGLLEDGEGPEPLIHLVLRTIMLSQWMLLQDLPRDQSSGITLRLVPPAPEEVLRWMCMQINRPLSISLIMYV